MHPWKSLVLMVVATLLSNSCLTGQQNPKKPTAVFSAVFWERFMSARFSYAPWGNQDDLNATFRDVQVGFSAPSQKFAYYGDGNLKLYSSLPVSNSEDGGTVKSEEANERVPMAEFPFSSEGDGTTRQYLLLFLKNTKANEPKYKVHALPFSSAEVPFGALKCYSQLRETVYFTFGKSKASLPSGKSTLIQGQIGAVSEFYPLAAYFLSAGKYEKVLTQSISFSNQQRGLMFFTKQRDRLRAKIFLEDVQPMEKSIGYGVQPYIDQDPEAKEGKDLPGPQSVSPSPLPES